jgi:ornithine--oxo-acid transaminase
VRGRGLWAGVEIAPGGPVGRAASEALAARGVLCKETHASTLRVAPPLVITRDEIDMGVQAIAEVVRPDLG